MICRDLRCAREDFTQLDREVSEIVSESDSEIVSESVSKSVSESVSKFAWRGAAINARPAASFATRLDFEVIIGSSREEVNGKQRCGNGPMATPQPAMRASPAT